MSHDVIILGGGIVGTALAYHLAPASRVLLLEAEGDFGYHATGRSAALFSGAYGSELVWRLSRCARPFFDRPPEGFCDGDLLTPRGTLYIAPEGEVDALARFHGQASRLVPHLEFGGEGFARELVPALRPGMAAAAMLDRAASDIDVARLQAGFIRGARSHGADLLAGQRVDRLTRTKHGWIVGAGEAEWSAPVVVNAAGAWADEVAALAGAAGLGLSALRRTMITVDVPDHQIAAWPLVTDLEESFYFKPDAGRLLVSPGDETPVGPCDAAPDEWDVAVAADRLETLTDVPVRRVAARWAGLRTFAPDRRPAIGFDAGPPGFFWLAGLGGFGVQTSPIIGRLAAALILDGPPPADVAEAGIALEALSPARFR